MARLLLALLLLIAPTAAFAQAAGCFPPRQIPRPQIEGPSKAEPRRVVPIGAHTLALSWSPQHCSMIYSAVNAREAFQCGGRNGRFGFVLHGLWPDGVGKEWPQYCRPASLLPRAVIAQNLCTTPSVQLLQHEWAKHGTCMGTIPELYFGLARALYQSIRYPDMTRLARQPNLTVDAFIAALVRVNRGLKGDMVRVRTTRGNWLDELWLCMDRQMEFARCPIAKRGADGRSLLRIEQGPAIAYGAPPVPRPVPTAAPPKPASKPGVRPKRAPSLRLDLDPNVQSVANSATP